VGCFKIHGIDTMHMDLCMTDLAVCTSRYTGKERDAESGLDYFGARYYGSNMGRWMSPDWAAKPEAVPYSHLDNPQSLNLYGYVLNNPLSKPDFDGHGCPPDCDTSTGASMTPTTNGGSRNPANLSGLNTIKAEAGGVAHMEDGKVVAMGGTVEISGTANAGFRSS
jgi:RHS repeat-associated protein